MIRRTLQAVCTALLLAATTGCLVPQPRGLGKQAIITEPKTKAQYHLYLPADYVKNNGVHPRDPKKLWPLVMTFHGMKPYDTWDRQAHEWEHEADNYGYIVCAPWLQTSDSFMEYPLRKEHDYVLRDRERVMAIMDHIFATTRADPKAVLSTSWSCGGYLAHYFPNRFPDRFTCIATRLSNFSPSLLVEQNVPKYRDVPVALYIGDGDFPACKSESQQAVAWYRARGFKATGKMIDNIGHKRIPQCAAAFFAEQIGAPPLYPERAAVSLAAVRMTDYVPDGSVVAAMSARPTQPGIKPPPTPPTNQTLLVSTQQPGGTRSIYEQPPPSKPSGSPPSGSAAARTAGQAQRGQPIAPAKNTSPVQVVSRDTRTAQPPAPSGVPAGQKIASTPPPRSTPSTTYRPPPANASRSNRPAPATAKPASPRSSGTSSPVASGSAARTANIRLTGPAVGTAPHYIAFSTDLPTELVEGADFLWMDNGMWICDEPRGVKILDTPGWHRISVLVLTRNGQEYRGSARVRVLAKGGSSKAG